MEYQKTEQKDRSSCPYLFLGLSLSGLSLNLSRFLVPHSLSSILRPLSNGITVLLPARLSLSLKVIASPPLHFFPLPLLHLPRRPAHRSSLFVSTRRTSFAALLRRNSRSSYPSLHLPPPPYRVAHCYFLSTRLTSLTAVLALHVSSRPRRTRSLDRLPTPRAWVW